MVDGHSIIENLPLKAFYFSDFVLADVALDGDKVYTSGVCDAIEDCQGFVA